MPDVFLSYASVDNTALAGPWLGQETWIKAFKVALQQAVDRELGRTGSADWFFDAKNLHTGDHLTDEICSALDKTKVFLAIASTGYFNEKSWCKKELQYFFQKLGPDAAKSRRILGVISHEQILSRWQAQTSPEILAFSFYRKDQAKEECERLGDGAIDPEFIQRINTLARDIGKRLQELDGVPQKDTQPKKGRIFLAAVPGEIENDRSTVAAALSKDWEVFPADNLCAADPETCRAEAEKIALGATAFIQILSPHPWKPHPYDHFQFQAAEAAKIPILRYRSDIIDLDKIPNLDHRNWLQDHDVAARSVLTMEKEILLEVQKLSLASNLLPHADDGAAYLTLSVGEPEKDTIGRHLSARFLGQNIYTAFARDDAASFESCYQNEHGLLTVFGNESYDRVEKALLEWRRLLAKYRPRPDAVPPCAIFLCEPPPLDKVSRINMTLPNLRIISWNNDQELNGFVEAIKQYAGRI